MGKSLWIVEVDIVRFVDRDFPGWVECQLVDAFGAVHLIHEKVPVVTTDDLADDATFPVPGMIAGEVIEEWQDDCGRSVVKLDTTRPWAIESIDGTTTFVLHSSRLKQK